MICIKRALGAVLFSYHCHIKCTYLYSVNRTKVYYKKSPLAKYNVESTEMKINEEI